MQFLKNWTPFIHKTNKGVYIEYSMQNQRWDDLPNTNMEFMVWKKYHYEILPSKTWRELKT